jgi:hypothetical protein
MARIFADDTFTGQWATGLRKNRRVTIVAKAEDASGFAWILGIKRDHLPPGAEAKAKTVLPLAEVKPALRALVLKNVETYPIVIVDLHAFRRKVYGDLVDLFRPIVPPGFEPFDFVEQFAIPGSNVQALVRQMAVNESVVGKLEAVISWSLNPLGEAVEKAFPGYGPPRPDIELIDRAAIATMNERHFAMLLARVGTAIGDALSPERQASVMEQAMDDQMFFSPGYYAAELVRVDMENDKTFDIGPAPVWRFVGQAESRVWEFSQRRIGAGLSNQVRRGLLDERSSQGELGLLRIPAIVIAQSGHRDRRFWAS